MSRLIRVIALRFLGSQTSKHYLDGRQRFYLERVEAQADLSLRGAHMQSSRKCCAPAQVLYACSDKQGGYVTWFFGRVHTFLNARFKVRKLTFLMFLPTNSNKTKCIADANMSTFHKHIAYLNPAAVFANIRSKC